MRANSSVGIEESAYNAIICGCHIAFKQNTASCATNREVGVMVSEFDSYSPAHCACADSGCNGLGKTLSAEAVTEEPDDNSLLFQLFTVGTFVCWGICCLGALIF